MGSNPTSSSNLPGGVQYRGLDTPFIMSDRKRNIPAEDPVDRHKGRKKKTGKWCKGKVGVEHKGVWTIDKRYTHFLSVWYTKRCTVCKKNLDYWIDDSKNPNCQGLWSRRWKKPVDLNLEKVK